jgi:hypothetical protein
MPHLAKYMPNPKDARRQIPDPENEPNFYEISRKYPLPDDPDFGKNDDLSDIQARPEPTKTKRLSPVPQSSVAAGLPRFVANPPTPATTRLGVALTLNALSVLAPATALAAVPLSALAAPHLPIQVAYPSIPGTTVPVISTIPATAVVDTNHAAIAAALRAGIAIGQGQSLVRPASLNTYQLQGLLRPAQGSFGGRF